MSGPDIVEELTALYVWPQSVADHHADILTPRQIEMLYAVGNVAERAAATIAALQAEVAALREAARDAISEIENSEQYNAADTLRAALERPKP